NWIRKSPVAVAQKNQHTGGLPATVRPCHHQVGIAISIYIGHRNVRTLINDVLHAQPKRSVPVSDIHAHARTVAATVRDGYIRLAIPIEVADCYGEHRSRHRVIYGWAERPVSIPHQHLKTAAVIIYH